MLDRARFLANLPAGLRDPLIRTYQEIAENYSAHRWEPSELNGGKFCEVVYTIVEGAISGVFPAAPSKPKDMVKACRALEDKSSDAARVGDRSLRILIPRMIQPLYEIRNNRGVGHIGGDVDPNFLDATAVYGMASWILAELVRIFHQVTTREAQEAVDTLIERKIPLVWEFENTRRVLNPSMSKSDQTLVLLHRHSGWVKESELVRWTDYSNPTVFRTKILGPLHKKRLIEHDRPRARARISPLGTREVENRILNP